MNTTLPRVRDFVVSKEGLVFAVTSYNHPKDRVIAFLRYIPGKSGLAKIKSTDDSYTFLRENHPNYLFYSKELDTLLQGVPLTDVGKIIHPNEFLTGLNSAQDLSDHEDRIIRLANLLSKYSKVSLEKFGVTGSVLVEAHTSASDIDLVVYGRDNFEKVRKVVAECEPPLKGLDDATINTAYSKRFPLTKELSFSEFAFHEKRKHTSGLFEGVKFDILYTQDWSEISSGWGDLKYKKIGLVELEAEVTDDTLAFDYPAVYKVSGTCSLGGRSFKVSELASYTHTYSGQVFLGEKAKVSGMLEEVSSSRGVHYRILVGSTREAEGEYIKLFTSK
ncbi:MAG: hypothetical protein ABH851_03610 [Methanobacteriota archaeon]